MSVTPHIPLTAATGDGTSTSVGFAWPLPKKEDIRVTVGGVAKTVDVDFSVTGVGGASGTVTFVTPPGAGVPVVIYRETTLSRAQDYQVAGDFLAPVVNADFDRVWYVLMELLRGSRAPAASLRVPLGETVSELPPMPGRALKQLTTDASGNVVATVPSSGSAADVLLQLASTASTTVGDALLGVKRNRSGSVSTTQHAINEGALINLAAEFGLAGDGATTGNVAKMVAATAGGGDFWLPPGSYLWDADFTLPTNCRIHFAQGAKLLASANGRTFFKTTANTYFSKIYHADLDHNGKTGVTGFDFSNLRHSAGIYWPTFSNGMANGIILRQLCWDFEIVNPFGQGVTNPIQVMDGSNTVRIEKPSFDGLGSAGAGILVVDGPTYATTGVRIVGGYIQGYAVGVEDRAIGTVIDSTYFEVCSTADVQFNGARGARAKNCGHYADVGPVCYKSTTGAGLAPSDGVIVEDPVMTSGSRSVGLFDFDATNANCYYRAERTAGGINLPRGTVAGIGRLPSESAGTFSPVVEGSSGAGVGTYTQQSGTWRRIGDQVHVQIAVAWTAHTGTGNISVSGIPTSLQPSSFTPRRIGQLVFVAGVAVSNSIVYAYLNGTATKLSLIQVSNAGSEALIPIATTGTLYINIVYDL
jgi:hypothetical protein